MDFKPLITLLAIVNPLAIVPFFIHYTQGFSPAQRKRTIWVSSFSAFVVIAASALLGLHILAFFGLSRARGPGGAGNGFFVFTVAVVRVKGASGTVDEMPVSAALACHEQMSHGN
ncbi:MAG: MarC family protein, partial [Burkholderiales bacterium]